VLITGIAISTAEPLCFTDRGLAYIAHVCWQVLVLAQLNLCVLLIRGLVYIAHVCWQVLVLAQLNL
jgi:hypothetical protein